MVALARGGGGGGKLGKMGTGSSFGFYKHTGDDGQSINRRDWCGRDETGR